MALLECWNLTKGRGGKTDLDRITMEVPAGRTVGILGPNGSGKSLLLRVAAGLAHPDEGELRIDGELVGVESRALTAYLPTHPFLPKRWKVKALVHYCRDFYGDFREEKAEEILDELEIPRKIRVGKLPAGQREMLPLILTMSRDASLYLLDEPFRVWDPAARDLLTGLIAKNRPEDSAVLIATQLIADVEPILDDVIFLKEGRLIEVGEAQEIRDREGMTIDQYFREVFR